MLKRITFVLMLSVAQSIIVLGYCNEPAQAATWYGIRYYHPYPQEENTPIISNLTYSLGTDTLINDKHYHQILYTHADEHITDAYRGAIRQSDDGQQVYYVPWGAQTEYLLYDFNVKQGDVVYAYAGFNDKSCEEMAEYDPEKTITPAWTVMNVQTIDGRKHIFVQNEDQDALEWIEGVGTQYILWAQGRTCNATGMEVQFQHTLCAVDREGNLLYSYDTDYIGVHNDCPNWLHKVQLRSLCDAWNVLHEPFAPLFDSYYTQKFSLTTDTIINGKLYAKLEQKAGSVSSYTGALREEDAATIYYVPAGGAREYLLYAFNASQGDSFDNIWIGGSSELYPASGFTATIVNDGNELLLHITSIDNQEFDRYMRWIKGVGMETGPVGWQGGFPGDPVDPTPALLCAYKNGEQVYVSEKGEMYGCEYNGNEQPIDNIHAYSPSAAKIIRDGQILILRGDKTYTITGTEVQ